MGFTRSRNPIVGPLLREGALASQAGAAALPGQFVAAGYSGVSLRSLRGASSIR